MSFNLGMSKLAGLIGDIIGAVIGAIFKPLFDFVLDIIKRALAIIPQLIYMLWACIAQIADAVQMLFRLLAGMNDSMVYLNPDALGHINGTPTGNFILDLLMSNIVMSVFSKMLVVAIILLIVMTFVAIIKNEYSSEGSQNSKGKIVGKSLKALFTFIFIPVLCLSGIMISNGLLQTLDAASSNGATANISAKVFVCAAYNANRWRTGEYKVEPNLMGHGKNNMSNTAKADLVDSWFGSAKIVKGTNNDADIGEYTFWGAIGSLDNGKIGGDTRRFTILDTGAVFHYYDLWSFNYIIGFVAISFITLTFISLLLGLAKRAIDLVILFVISPPIVAVMPLDNGQMFGKWKTEFVKRVLNTYAPVVAMNLYLIILPLFMNINVFKSVINSYNTDAPVVEAPTAIVRTVLDGAGDDVTPDVDVVDVVTGPLAFVINSIFQLVMIIAGAIAVKSSIDWISDLIGAENLAKTSKEMNEGTMAMGSKAAAIGFKGLKVGGKLVGGAAKFGGKTLGAVGKGAGRVLGATGKLIGKGGKAFANSKVGKAIGHAGAWTGKKIGQGASWAGRKIGQGAAWLGKHTGVVAAAKGIGKAGAWTGKKIGQGVGGAAKWIGNTTKAGANWVKNSKFGKGVAKTASNFGSAVKDSFKGVGKGIKDDFGKIIAKDENGKRINPFKGMGGLLKDFGGSVFSFSGAKGLVGKFEEAFNPGAADKRKAQKDEAYREEARENAREKRSKEKDFAKIDNMLVNRAKAAEAAVDREQDSAYLQQMASSLKTLVDKGGTGAGTLVDGGLNKVLAEVKANVEIKTKAQIENIINDKAVADAVHKHIEKEMAKKK